MITLAHHRSRQRVESGFAVTPKVAHTRHHQWKEWRQKRLQVIADEEVFLPWLAHDCRRIDRVATMRDRLAVKDWIVVLQRIVAVMITERAFGPALMRWRMTNQGKFGFRHQPMRSPDRILCHS